MTIMGHKGDINSKELFDRTRDIGLRAFGDMGPSTQVRMVHDRFVTGHRNWDLRWHLDSVPPVTPIREIVDRCRVWESHSNMNNRCYVAPTFT